MSSQLPVDQYGYSEVDFPEAFMDNYRERSNEFYAETFRKLFGSGVATAKHKRIAGGHQKLIIELPKFMRPTVPERQWLRRFLTRWVQHLYGVDSRDVALFEGDREGVSVKIVLTLWAYDILK